MVVANSSPPYWSIPPRQLWYPSTPTLHLQYPYLSLTIWTLYCDYLIPFLSPCDFFRTQHSPSSSISFSLVTPTSWHSYSKLNTSIFNSRFISLLVCGVEEFHTIHLTVTKRIRQNLASIRANKADHTVREDGESIELSSSSSKGCFFNGENVEKILQN